jgi:hypothetical protein
MATRISSCSISAAERQHAKQVGRGGQPAAW